MVWCASTLWAETSVGSFRDRWLESLQRRGLTSALLSSPPMPAERSAQQQQRRSPSPIFSDCDTDGEFSSGRRSPSPADDLADVRRKQLVEKLDASAAAHDLRASCIRSNRVAALRERKEQREAHTRVVVDRANARRDERIRKVQGILKEREKRLLPAIEQCETQEQSDALRTASFQVIITAQRVLSVANYRIKLERMVKTLKLLLVPILRLWRARRNTLGRTYAGIWRGRCNRPTVVVMKALLPSLQSWTATSVQKLIRKMRPMSVPAGIRILSSGEPGVCGLYISSGRVAVQQPRLNAPPLELGERGAAYFHGEEVLVKDEVDRHYTHLQALELTYGWYLSRAAYRQGLANAQDQGDLLTATQVVVANSASKTEGYVAQAIENNKRLLAGWLHEELFEAVDAATERSFSRGDLLYSPEDKKATHVFLIVRGTILLAQQIKRVGGGGGHHRDSMAGPAGLGGGGADITTSISADFSAGSPPSMGEFAPSVLLPEHLASGGGTAGGGALAAVGGEEFLKEYANTGQIVGADAVLFASHRTEFCICATDCVVLEICAKSFINGMFSDPVQLIQNKDFYNQQRALRLLPPTAAHLFPACFHQQPLAAFFLRTMTPLVVGRGEPLPLQTSIVYLQSGTVEIDGRTFKGPCLLIGVDSFERISKNFEAAMKAGGGGSLELIRPERDPTRVDASPLESPSAATGRRKSLRSGVGVVRAARKLREGSHHGTHAAPHGASTPSPSTGGGYLSATPAASPGTSFTAFPTQTQHSDGVDDSSAPPAEVSAPPKNSPTTATEPTSSAAPNMSTASDNLPDAPGPSTAPLADPQQTQVVGAGVAGAQGGHTAASASWGYIPLAGSMTLVVKPPFLRDGDAGDGNGRVRFRQLPPAMQLAMLADDLVERVPCVHKTTSRVEAWCVRTIDFLRKFHGNQNVSATKVSDYVRGEALEHLTPQKD